MPRQPQIGDQHVERELIEQLERLLAAVGLDHLEPLFGETLGRQLAQGGFVVHEQEVGRLGSGTAPTF